MKFGLTSSSSYSKSHVNSLNFNHVGLRVYLFHTLSDLAPCPLTLCPLPFTPCPFLYDFLFACPLPLAPSPLPTSELIISNQICPPSTQLYRLYCNVVEPLPNGEGKKSLCMNADVCDRISVGMTRQLDRSTILTFALHDNCISPNERLHEWSVQVVQGSGRSQAATAKLTRSGQTWAWSSAPQSCTRSSAGRRGCLAEKNNLSN